MDKNDMARFLDNRLSEEEHAGAVAHLSASDEDAELLADAGYLLRDLEAEDGLVAADDAAAEPDADGDTGSGAKVLPLRPPSTAHTWRRPPARWLALAAVLAGVLLIPLAISRSGGRGPGDPAQFAALLASREAGLPTDWDRRSWTVRRGGGDPVVDNARAARLGVLHLDLELAVAARQAEETEVLAERIASMMDEMPAGGTVAVSYREIAARAGEPPEALASLLARGREDLAGFVDQDHFALGAWAEAARFAAGRRDAEFFRARASRKMLDRAGSLAGLDEEGQGAAESIRTAVQGEGQPDWAARTSHTDQLLASIGG